MPKIESCLITRVAALHFSQKDNKLRRLAIHRYHDGGSFDDLLEAHSTALERETAEKSLTNWEKAGIHSIGLGEQGYPELLSKTTDPPLLLFYRGPLAALKSKTGAIAIVGSRSGNTSGCKLAGKISAELAQQGVAIVSGLAIGIDTSAHEGALNSDFDTPTVAVLANGLDSVYPRQNERLAERILERDGIILSEFEPGVRPKPYQFLQRNRIIAGISQGTAVIQANTRSGALSTARHALEESRDVFAVPGDIEDPRHRGTNKLIQQGAYLIENGTDIISIAYPELEKLEPTPASHTLNREQKELLNRLLQERELPVDDALRIIKGSEHHLLELEMFGLVERAPGNKVKLVSS